MKYFYLICGYGVVAQQTASKLRRKGRTVVVLDTDLKRIKIAKENGLDALTLDPASLSTYKSLGIDFAKQVKGVLLLRESDVLNIYTALTLRNLVPHIELLSILHEKNNRRKLQLAGIEGIVYAQEIVGILSKEYSGKPVAFEALDMLTMEHTSTDMLEVVVDSLILENARYVGDLHIRKSRLILMGILQKETEVFLFNPKANTELQDGDILVVVGELSMIKEFKLVIHQSKRFL